MICANCKREITYMLYFMTKQVPLPDYTRWRMCPLEVAPEQETIARKGYRCPDCFKFPFTGIVVSNE